MKIKHFSDPIEFQGKIEESLVKHEAENNLPLGILNGVISGEYAGVKPYLGLVEKKGYPVIVALCTPPYPVILSYQDPAPDQEAVELLLRDLMESLGEDFRGISADKYLAERMMNGWEQISGSKARLIMSMRIYKLDRVLKPAGIPGAARAASRDDRQTMLAFYSGFHRDAMLEEPDPERVAKQVDNYLNSDPRVRGLWFWEVDGQLVSMAGYAGPTPNGIRIGAVYTPPEHRRKGYASAATAAVSQLLLDQGYQFCFLFTDLLNPTSNHIYQQIGYRSVCDVDRYDFQ